MILTPLYWWLLAGAAMIVLEFSGLTGIGLFFAGLAAFSVGVLLAADMVAADATGVQFAWFFGFTAVWAALLWKPLQRMLKGKKGAGEYRHIVGDEAKIVHHALVKGTPGEVSWSGTIMNARLADDSAEEHLAVGTLVTVVDMQGATLYVKKK